MGSFFSRELIGLLAGTQEEIAQTDERLRQALVSRDAAALQQLLDDEFRVVHVDGIAFINEAQKRRAGCGERLALLPAPF